MRETDVQFNLAFIYGGLRFGDKRFQRHEKWKI